MQSEQRNNKSSKKSIIPRMVARIQAQGPRDHFTRLIFDSPGIDKIRRILLSFMVGDFQTVTQVNGKWYIGFHNILQELLEELDNRFIKMYMNILSFRNSEFRISPFKSGNMKLFRWDRIIIAEVLEGLQGKCVTIGLRYKNHQRHEYRFDVLADKQSKTTWVLRQKTSHDFGEQISQTPYIPQVVTKDCVKIAINFFNKIGFMDPSAIVFEPPKVENNKQQQCQIERLFRDWVFYEYDSKKPDLNQYYLGPQLRMIDCRCAGVDTRAIKFVYEAHEVGYVRSGTLGIAAEVVKQGQDVVTEIKKYGLMADMQDKVQMRKDDKLIFYVTEGD